jgi:hypothetical protein
MHCSATTPSWITDCLAAVSGFLSRILLFISAVGLLAAVVKSDRLVAVLLTWGVPLSLCQPATRAVALWQRITSRGQEAYALHQLAGRRLVTRSERFILLGDILKAAVIRDLVEGADLSAAIESRVRQRAQRPTFSTHIELRQRDVVTALGVVTLLVVFEAI